MSTETSELHITGISRADKGKWVAASRKDGTTLSAWAIKTLNAATQNIHFEAKLPAWTKGLSKRVAISLLQEGYAGKREVRKDFENEAFEALKVPNLGRKGVDEVMQWLQR
jgi:hypothetical protein